MKPRKDQILFTSELGRKDLKKMIFEQQNLLDIAISLSSNLKFESLVESILFICIGQLVIGEIAIFINTDLNSRNLTLYMQRGYEIEESSEISNKSQIYKIAYERDEIFTKADIADFNDLNESDEMILSMKPEIIMPLKSKNSLNGLIIIGERLIGQETSVDEISFLTYISRFASIAVENSRLYQMATTDRMSGLFIHHYFHERLSEEVLRSERHETDLSLILLDIDHFKDVNDTYGHMCGDFIIKELSKIIRNHIRGFDIAARYGGEEFAVILPDTTISDANVIAERLRKIVEKKTFSYSGLELNITISIGVSKFISKSNMSSADFINITDSALYESKNGGRNRTTVYGRKDERS